MNIQIDFSKKKNLIYHLSTSTSALLSRRQALSWLYVLFFIHTCLWTVLGLFLGSFDISFVILSVVWFWLGAPVCFFFCIVFLIFELFFPAGFMAKLSFLPIIGGAPLLCCKLLLLFYAAYLLMTIIKMILKFSLFCLGNGLRMSGFIIVFSIYSFWYFFRYDLGFFFFSVVFELMFEFFVIIYLSLVLPVGKLFKPMSFYIKRAYLLVWVCVYKFLFFLDKKQMLKLDEEQKISLGKRIFIYEASAKTDRDYIKAIKCFRTYISADDKRLPNDFITATDLKKMRNDARELRHLYIELRHRKKLKLISAKNKYGK